MKSSDSKRLINQAILDVFTLRRNEQLCNRIRNKNGWLGSGFCLAISGHLLGAYFVQDLLP